VVRGADNEDVKVTISAVLLLRGTGRWMSAPACGGCSIGAIVEACDSDGDDDAQSTHEESKSDNSKSQGSI